MSNFLPDLYGSCPVCKRSWDGGGGRSLTKRTIKKRAVRHPLTGTGEYVYELIKVRCPFCQTEWEV